MERKIILKIKISLDAIYPKRFFLPKKVQKLNLSFKNRIIIHNKNLSFSLRSRALIINSNFSLTLKSRK